MSDTEQHNPLDEQFNALDLEHFLPYRLRVLSQTISKCLSNIYTNQFGLGPPEWRAMAIIGKFQPLSANAICNRSSMDKVKVSRALARLSEAGLIVREVDEHDRRRSELRLSERGQSVYSSLVPQVQELEQSLIDSLTTDEVEQFSKIIEKIQNTATSISDEKH